MKFAIIIPAYKAAATIAATIQSLAACQPEIMEAHAIYLVDDCSPDNQVEVALATWSYQQPSLKELKPPMNGGVWASSSLGIEAAWKAGIEWVLLLHADDLVKPFWLREMLNVIKNAPVEVATVCSSYDNLFPDGRITTGEHIPEREVEIISARSNTVRDTLLAGCWWHVSGCAIRTVAFKEIGAFNSRYQAFADWDWILRILSGNKWAIAYLPRTLMLYRQHAGSITAQTIRTSARLQEQIEIVTRFESYLNRRERLRWSIQQIYFALRRLGRDLITLNGSGLIVDLYSLRLLLINDLIRQLKPR